MVKEKYDYDDVIRRAQFGIDDGVVEGWCSECSMELRMEPDAYNVYCDQCEAVVKADNPLVMLGVK